MNKKKDNVEFVFHLLVWLILYFLPVAIASGTGWHWQQALNPFWIQLTLIAIIFYVNYFFLIDYFLFGKYPWLSYVILNLILLLSMVFVRNQIFIWTADPGHMDRKGPPRQLSWYMDFLMYLVPVAMSIAIKTGKRMAKVESLQAESENFRLQAELQQLKFQFQPHFLFNSLNNVYSLIEIDPIRAQQSIHSLSRLLRHLLQNSEVSHITLEEELDFLKKYIQLMQLRIPSSTTVEIRFPTEIPAVKLVPLVCITLVENAFKHGVSATRPSLITFDLQVVGSRVLFSSSNEVFPKKDEDLSRSGIGLNNLRKRLEIMYPDQFILNYFIKNNRFFVTLDIPVVKS